MPKVSTSISLDSDVKAQAQALFADFGLDLSTAINMFLRQAIFENCIPFSIHRNVPNPVTIEAMREAEEMVKNPAAYKRYDTFADLLREVEVDA